MILVMSIEKTFAQQPFFSQYQYAPLLVNPAQVVNDYNIKAIAFYRNQYRQPDPNYRTPSLTLILPFVNKETNFRWGGVGLNIYSDQSGTAPRLYNQGINFTYGQNLKLTKLTFLAIGLQGGYYQFGLSTNDYKTGEQYSNNDGYNSNAYNGESRFNQNKDYLDISSGIQLTGEDSVGRQKYYIGISGYHLNRPDYSLLAKTDRMLIFLQMNAGYRVFHSSLWSVIPEIYAWRSETNLRLTGGVKVMYYFKDEEGLLKEGHFAVIPRYNYNNSMAVGLELQIKNFFAAFNYDFNQSPMAERISNHGAYEIALGFTKSLYVKKAPVVLPDYTLGDLRRLYKTQDLDEINKQIKEQKAKDEGEGTIRTYNENDTSWYRSKDYRFELEKRFTFGFNKTEIGDDARKFADDLVAMLKNNPNLKLSIIGYSDDIGSEKANMYISNERARSLVKYMESKGINPKRLRFEGKGESEPLNSNNTKEERAKNRRIRFLIY